MEAKPAVVDTKAYKPPSNVKPALFVGGLALIYPVLLALRIYRTPDGIYGLPVTYSTLWFLFYLWQLRYHTIPFFTTPLNSLPRPPDETTVLGSTRQQITRHVAFTQWSRTIPNDGLIFIRGLLHFPHLVLLTSTAAITEVLNTRAYDFEKPADARRFLTRVLGTGLVVAEGQAHKWQRRAVAPAFQGRHTRELVPLFWAKARQMVELTATEKAAGKDRYHRGEAAAKSASTDEKGRRVVEVEIGGLASRATLNIIGKAGFGRDFNTVENAGDELANQYDIILNPDRGGRWKTALFFLINITLPHWFTKLIPWPMNQRINRAAYRLRDICKDLISDKKRTLGETKAQNVERRSDEVDILSVLLRKEEIDDDGLVNQMLTFLAAGHETTSSALTWCTYLLSANQSIQSKLRDELQNSPLADLSADITAENLDSLPYLSAVCAETLRFYPTVPVTARVALRETRVLDQVIPKGTALLICPWAVNRNPEIWGPDADEFRPERWLEGDDMSNGEKRMNTYDFLTFLHGPRSCIGQGFARSELKCLLAALILRFRMDLAKPGEVPVPAGIVTIKPKNGMRLLLTDLGGSMN